MFIPIYYQGKKHWAVEDYAYLNRCVSKLFDYYGKENDEEISKLNFTRISYIAQLMMLCTIKSLKKEWLFDKYPHLNQLRTLKPLPFKLRISPYNFGNKIYAEMNLIM